MSDVSWHQGYVQIAKIEAREGDRSVRIRLVSEDRQGYVDVEIGPQDLAVMLLNGEVVCCRYRSGVVAMKGCE